MKNTTEKIQMLIKEYIEYITTSVAISSECWITYIWTFINCSFSLCTILPSFWFAIACYFLGLETLSSNICSFI
jgi:hypothetical protein